MTPSSFISGHVILFSVFLAETLWGCKFRELFLNFCLETGRSTWSKECNEGNVHRHEEENGFDHCLKPLHCRDWCWSKKDKELYLHLEKVCLRCHHVFFILSLLCIQWKNRRGVKKNHQMKKYPEGGKVQEQRLSRREKEGESEGRNEISLSLKRKQKGKIQDEELRICSVSKELCKEWKR